MDSFLPEKTFDNSLFLILKFEIEKYIKNTKNNINKSFCPIYMKLYCKFLDYNQVKFVVKFPICLLATITQSAYEFLKIYKDKDEMLTRFFNIKPYSYINRGCFLTNHVPISTLKFIIYDHETLNLFQSIHNKYLNCFTDIFFYSSNLSFEFLIQNQLNFGQILKIPTDTSGVFEKKIYKKSYCTKNNHKIEIINIMFNIVHKIDLFNIYKNNVYNKNLFIYYKDLFNKFKYSEYNFQMLNNITFETCCFDIEIGFVKQEDLKLGIFPNPLNSYTQCICLIENRFKKSYETHSVYYVYCFNPYNHFDNKKILDMMSNYKRSFYGKNIYFYIFNSEKEMIYNFLVHVQKYDFIFGYNSKAFDLTYLIQRLNHLDNNLYSKQYFNSFILFNDWNIKIQNIFSISKIQMFCPTCNTPNYSYKKDFKFYCKCGNIYSSEEKYSKIINIKKKNEFEFNFLFHVDLFNTQLKSNLENGKLETVSNFYFKQKIKKFIDKTADGIFLELNDIHVNDLYSFLRVYTTNTKIILFKIMQSSNELYDKHFFILKNIFLYNIDETINLSDLIQNLNFSQIDKYSNCYYTKKYFQIDKVQEKKLKCVIQLNLNDKQHSELNLLEIKNYFLSVGKTSSLTLEEQQYWTSEKNMFETIKYCIKDVELTFELELYCKSIINYINMDSDKIPLFYSLDLDAPQKTEFIDLFALYNENFLFKHKSFNQEMILFTNALKIECPLLVDFFQSKYREDLLKHNYKLDNFKINNDVNKYLYEKSNQYVEKINDQTGEELKTITSQFLSSFPIIPVESVDQTIKLITTEIENVNEFLLNTSGEYDSSNLEEFKKNVNILLNNKI